MLLKRRLVAFLISPIVPFHLIKYHIVLSLLGIVPDECQVQRSHDLVDLVSWVKVLELITYRYGFIHW